MSRLAALCISLAVLILDRITKALIEKHVMVGESRNVIPAFFDIVHAKNRGAAFGMFSDGHSELRTYLLIGVSLAVLVFVGVLLLKPERGGFKESRVTMIGLALVLGGALGNIYDRIVFGMVTDFLEFYVGEWRFAAFNVADSAITVGAGLLLLDMWRTRNEPPHNEPAQTERAGT